MRLDELSYVVRRSRRTMEDSSSRRIMCLVPVFIPETHNQTNNESLPKFVETDNASSSIKMANILIPHVYPFIPVLTQKITLS